MSRNVSAFFRKLIQNTSNIPVDANRLPPSAPISDSRYYPPGAYDEVLVRNEQFVFARRSGEQYKLIALNLTDHAETLYFSYQGKEYEVLLEAYTSKIME